MTLLSRRPVLKNDKGQPISARFQDLSMKVSGLTANWELDLEGELIVALVEASADLYLNDLNQLAGALYLNRANEIETKVGEIISFLLNTNRLIEGDDISNELLEWANELRVLRNLGAHATNEKIDVLDATGALDFLQAILEIMYDLRPRFEEFKQRRRAT